MRLARPDAPLLDQLLIVPAVHVRLTDLDLQLEMYELFHLRAPTRWLHAACTPLVVGLTGALLARVSLGALGLSAAVPYWVALVVYHVVLHPAAALALTPVYALLMGSAGALAGVSSAALATALALAVSIQTASHMFEDVPPPLSGRPGFAPLAPWWRSLPWRRRAAVAVASALVFTTLELFASYRVLCVQALRGLFALGYRPALRARMEAAARRHLAEAEG